MTATEKLESRQEKIKEKLEEKAREKREAEVSQTQEDKSKEKVEKIKPKKKVEIKKPVVSEATGKGIYLPVSMKEATEIARAIRGKTVAKANQILDYVIKLERPIRYFRYKKEVPHQKGKGFGAGRFPQKTARFMKDVLRNAVANAKYLNLAEDKLYIKTILTYRSIAKQRQGRYTTIVITVAEKTGKE